MVAQIGAEVQSVRSLNQRQLRACLYAIEHNFRAAGRDVEVANDEILRKLGEHMPGTRLQIEEPEVLVGDFTTQNHECLCAMKKRNPSRATCQQHPRQWIGPAICGGGSDRIVAIVTPGHPLAKATAVSLQSLAASPSILREPGSGTREIVGRAFARHRLQLRCSLHIGSSEAGKRAALQGVVGWISEPCVAEELHTGHLVALRIPRLFARAPALLVAFAWPPSKPKCATVPREVRTLVV